VPKLLAPSPPADLGAVVAPTIAVVIAAFEASDVIGTAIDSVLAQSVRPDEIIVADDGSTDDLAGALAPYGASVRLVRIEHGGEARARNAAIAAANAEFVAVLDADDRFAPGRLASVVRVLTERPDLDLITTDAVLELDGRIVGTVYHEGHRFEVGDQRSAILDRNFVFGQVVVRRARMLELGGYDETITHTTDWECWIRLVLAGGRLGCIDAPLGVYTMREAAMSASRRRMYEGRVATLSKTLADARLTAPERARVVARRDEEVRRSAREALRVALLREDPARRTLAWAVARDGGQPAPARLRSLVAAVAPTVVGRRLRARARDSWVGVGDRRFPRTNA
jgi:glycosyltransferase involved in cell wall biosynthesis